MTLVRCQVWGSALAVGLLFSSCGGDREGARATVSLGETEIKLGQEVNLRVEHASDGWSGEVNVNNVRHFPIDAKNHSLRVIPQNGFNRNGDNDLYVMLMDRNGHEIPLDNHGSLQFVSMPGGVILLPPADKVPARKGSGEIRVTAEPGYAWSVKPKSVPAWMKIAAGDQGSGNGTIAYQLAENTSNHDRSAAIEIGDAVFEITQLAPVLKDSPVLKTDATAETRGAQEVSAASSRLPVAKVALDKTVVKMGEEIQIHTEQVPVGWSGELLVNSLRHFQFESRLYRLKASVDNGFNPEGPTKLYILLTDPTGSQIPVTNGGHFSIVVAPSAVILDRRSRNVEAEGVSSHLSVTASPGYHWSVGGVPSWIKIGSGIEGSGNGTISYTVEENTTNEARSARLTVGDAAFEVSQLHPPEIQLPYHDNFHYSATPPPVWSLIKKGGTMESPVHWVLDEQPGLRSIMSIEPKAPKGGNSLLIQKHADPRHWAAQLFLPGIKMQEGGTYRVSAWMKAENPGSVAIAFGQKSAPFRTCGLDHVFSVSKNWTELTVPFRVTGQGCDASNNRLLIEVGQIDGKVWIANFSLAQSR